MKTRRFIYFCQKSLEQSIEIALLPKLLSLVTNYIATLLHF